MAIDVAAWLRALGLGQYEAAFRDNAIDATVLPSLTADDLKEIGVAAVGHRRKLLDALAKLEGAAGDVPPARATQTGERRQVTVMFADLVGSTALAARLDPEDLRTVIEAYHRAAAAAVAAFDGFVAQYLGDGVLAYFGYPLAHEDDGERAIRAALKLVAAIPALRVDGGEPLACRIGIASGLVVVGDVDGAGERRILGDTPNLAARLQALAEPNTIVIGAATRQLVGGLFETRELGPVAIKGFSEPVLAWQILGQGQVDSRFEALRPADLSPLVGRSEELERLARRWERARRGDGQVVLLSGEAGIGKSRLSAALLEQAAEDPHTRLTYFCSPHHRDSPLQPFIAQLERAAAFARDDSAPVRLAKLDALLAAAGDSAADAAGAIADLLALASDGRFPPLPTDPQRRREMTLDALLRQLEGLARQRPVLVLFEDAHWADSTSLELLDRVVERIRHLPVMLLVSFRPDFTPPWTGLAHVALISLNRLGQSETEALVDGVVAGRRLPPEILARIVERTDGIPLFVEELTKSIVEGGLLRDAGGALELDGPLPPLAIPSSLQASLLARLDRLSAVKEVAQIGAAIGREFEHGLLARVARRSDDALAEALDQLAEAGLVFRRGTPPRASYRFKHALVQDAAYSTLLRGRRQELHGRIAQALADDFHDVAANQPEILAHHFSEAGLAERAVEYWQRAGEHALQRSANIEAIAHFTSGVRLIGSLAAGRERDARELALRLALGPALMASRGFGVPEVEATYARSRELCRDLGAGPDLFAALRGLWEYYEIRAHTQTGVELAREAFAIAEQSGDPALLVVAHDIVGDTSLWIPDFAAAIEHTTRALELYDPDRDGRLALAHGSYDPTMACRLFGAHALWHQGCADRALQQCRDALAFARALDHPPTSGFVGQIAVHHYLRREPLAVEAHAEAAIAIARQNHLQFWLALATIVRGWATAMLGRTDGIAEIRRGIADYRATGAELECSVWAAMLADALLQHGRDEEAGKVAVEALAETARTGVRVFAAELHRLHGRSLARAGASAEVAFQRALEVARSQGAKSLELRAATDLARAWLSAGRQDEARGLLRPIYDGFAEGFDTADLEAARTVLG